jgi:uncharacterized protein
VELYVDTSALVKRYVREAHSDAFDAFLDREDHGYLIGPLVTTEFESVLERLQRQKIIGGAFARQARSDLAADLASSLWSLRTFDAISFQSAAHLMRTLQSPLSTLDALHLASALGLQCDGLVTADRQLAKAATECGLAVTQFFG